VLRVGVDFQTKSGKERAVEFNDELERLLVSMRDKRAPDSAFLFPSIRTEGDGPAAREPKAWAIARQKTGLAIKPHDLRHFFTSFCVMSGIDWLSIAQWTGHADASLIAKTYAHLRPEYRQQAARRIRFQPVALERVGS
jgi:integrase